MKDSYFRSHLILVSVCQTSNLLNLLQLQIAKWTFYWVIETVHNENYQHASLLLFLSSPVHSA